MESYTVNRAVRAAFAVNKNDREELILAKKKLINMQNFLISKGFYSGKL